MIFIINKDLHSGKSPIFPSHQMRSFCPRWRKGDFTRQIAFHLNGTPFQHGRELRGTPLESNQQIFKCLKKELFFWMDEAMKCKGALFWKDIWRRSKSDSAIVIVRYISVLFVVYLSLLHIDRLSRKAFASTGSSRFCYILTCQISFLPVVSKKSFNLTTWGSTATSESCRDHSEVPVGPFWRGPEAGFTVYSWLKFYMLCYRFCEIHADFPQLLSSLGVLKEWFPREAPASFFVARVVDASFWSSDRAAWGPLSNPNVSEANQKFVGGYTGVKLENVWDPSLKVKNTNFIMLNRIFMWNFQDTDSCWVFIPPVPATFEVCQVPSSLVLGAPNASEGVTTYSAPWVFGSWNVMTFETKFPKSFQFWNTRNFRIFKFAEFFSFILFSHVFIVSSRYYHYYYYHYYYYYYHYHYYSSYYYYHYYYYSLKLRILPAAPLHWLVRLFGRISPQKWIAQVFLSRWRFLSFQQSHTLNQPWQMKV